jgi:uncharacterized protein DUF6867
MVEDLLGTSLWAFLGFTVVLFGGASWMMGQALAATWRPVWQNVPYGLMLGIADRFFQNALFAGDMLSPTGFVIDTAVLTGLALVSYRLTRAYKMVAQYPWLYERNGLFGWRERRSSS